MPSVTKSLPQRRGKIDPVKAYQLRVHHRLTFQQIADQMDVTKTAVIQRLKQFSNLIHTDEDKAKYESIRTQALTTLEEQLIASLSDPDKIAKASLNNVAYAFQQIHTARRLEENKSTENKALLTMLLDQAHDTLHGSKSTAGASVPGRRRKQSVVEVAEAPASDTDTSSQTNLND